MGREGLGVLGEDLAAGHHTAEEVAEGVVGVGFGLLGHVRHLHLGGRDARASGEYSRGVGEFSRGRRQSRDDGMADSRLSGNDGDTGNYGSRRNDGAMPAPHNGVGLSGMAVTGVVVAAGVIQYIRETLSHQERRKKAMQQTQTYHERSRHYLGQAREEFRRETCCRLQRRAGVRRRK